MITPAKKYFLYEVHVNDKKVGTYRLKETATREASSAMIGNMHNVKIIKVLRLPGPSFDDDGNTIIIDARGYGRRVE